LKCLLSEISEEEYMAKIYRVIMLLSKDEKADDDKVKARLDTCKACDYLADATCQACGCYVELRAARKDSKCPYKKWNV
jgi:hypothetical protein